MLFGIVSLIVHAQTERHVRFLGRGADEDTFGAALAQVQFSFIAAGEKAGRFQNDVGPEIFPGQIARIAFF